MACYEVIFICQSIFSTSGVRGVYQRRTQVLIPSHIHHVRISIHTLPPSHLTQHTLPPSYLTQHILPPSHRSGVTMDPPASSATGVEGLSSNSAMVLHGGDQGAGFPSMPVQDTDKQERIERYVRMSISNQVEQQLLSQQNKAPVSVGIF